MLARIRQFWTENEPRIVLVIGFVLVAGLSFEAGLIKGRVIQEKPLVIEKTVPAAVPDAADSSAAPNPAVAKASDQSAKATDCAFVGSKNSDKYHLPSCQWAKRIKPENLACFSSAEDAAKKGYKPDSNCVK